MLQSQQSLGCKRSSPDAVTNLSLAAKRSPRLEAAAQIISDMLGGSTSSPKPPTAAVLSALAPLFEPSTVSSEQARSALALADLREYATEVSRLGAVAGSQWYWQAPPGKRRCRYMAFCRHLQGEDGCRYWHSSGEVDLIAATRIFEEHKASYEAKFGPLDADDFNCGGSSAAPPSSAPPLRLFHGSASPSSASKSFSSRGLGDNAWDGGSVISFSSGSIATYEGSGSSVDVGSGVGKLSGIAGPKRMRR